MKSQSHWPLHPPRTEGEALSSWLTRIAAAHHLRLADLLSNGLGNYTFNIFDRAAGDLDVNPPDALLAALEERTGRDRDELWSMTVAGAVPWLLDTLEPSDDPDAFATYVHQHQVFIPVRSTTLLPSTVWRPWLPQKLLHRACPVCVLGSVPIPGTTLASLLPLTLSCPLHACYLEPVYGPVDGRIIWPDKTVQPRPAPPAVQAMDRRTHAALRTGTVSLPRRDIHAAVWFRLLRTIIDELTTPASYARAQTRALRTVWSSIDQQPRGGQNAWRPFESLDWTVQQRMLEGAAAAIELMETGAIQPDGRDGRLFRSPPTVPISDGTPPREQPKEVNYLQKAMDSLREVIDLARTDPVTADQMYRFLQLGSNSPDEARRMLASVGISLPASPETATEPSDRVS